MKYFQSFLLVSVTSLNVGAQPAHGSDTASAQATLEQRRAELRLLLRAASLGEAQLEVQENGAANRRLSMQERADLRQQLRQQRRDGKPE